MRFFVCSYRFFLHVIYFLFTILLVQGLTLTLSQNNSQTNVQRELTVHTLEVPVTPVSEPLTPEPQIIPETIEASVESQDVTTNNLSVSYGDRALTVPILAVPAIPLVPEPQIIIEPVQPPVESVGTQEVPTNNSPINNLPSSNDGRELTVHTLSVPDIPLTPVSQIEPVLQIITEPVEPLIESFSSQVESFSSPDVTTNNITTNNVPTGNIKRELTIQTSLLQSTSPLQSPSQIQAPPQTIAEPAPLPTEWPNVGRLMMVAFEQSDTETQTILETIQPGGFAFFPGDIVSTLQIKTLTESLQERAEHPLIFAIDQEGGPFTSYRIDEATLFPGAMMLAATNDTDLAKRVGEATAKELNYAGLTMNFAPVADVNSNPDNPIIGIRSFGDDPAKVSAFSQAFAEGSMAAGVASVAKHFPGHGNTTTDSHIGLPRIESTLEEMRATDLEPFQGNLNSAALMTAHIIFPALDDIWPATLSRTILTDLLRTDMGYEGLVITDSLVMGALTNTYSAGTIAVKAINAGADMLLVGASFNEQKIIYNALENAVKTGEIPLWRLEEALARIDKLATTYVSVDVEDVPEVPDYEAHRELALEVAVKGTTLVSDTSQVIPFDNALSVTVVAPKPRGFGTPPHLGDVLSEFLPSVRSSHVSVNPSSSQIRNAVAASQNADVIVLGIYYWLGDFPRQMRELHRVLNTLGKPVIIVSLGNPNIETHLGVVPDAHIAAYGYRYSNLYGVSAVLAGEIEAIGTLPVGTTPLDTQ